MSGLEFVAIFIDQLRDRAHSSTNKIPFLTFCLFWKIYRPNAVLFYMQLEILHHVKAFSLTA